MRLVRSGGMVLTSRLVVSTPVVESNVHFVLSSFEYGEAKVGGASQHTMTHWAGQEVELLVAGPPAKQAKAQGASDHPLEQLGASTPEETGERFDQSLLVDQRIAEPIGLDGLSLACASARCSFDRIDSEPNTISMSTSRSASRNSISTLLDRSSPSRRADIAVKSP